MSVHESSALSIKAAAQVILLWIVELLSDKVFVVSDSASLLCPSLKEKMVTGGYSVRDLGSGVYLWLGVCMCVVVFTYKVMMRFIT